MKPLPEIIREYGVKKLAEKIGVSQGAVSQWVSGHRQIPADRAKEIKRVIRRDAANTLRAVKSL